MNEYFSKVKKVGEEIEQPKIRLHKKVGKPVGGWKKLPYSHNYRKRRKNDKKMKRMHKYLRYPMELHERMKLELETEPHKWKNLQISNLNDMFVVAVQKLLDENE